MSDHENPPPDREPDEDEGLEEVAELGGDPEIMESLPDEGSPLEAETAYDALEESGALEDGEARAYPPNESPGESQPVDQSTVLDDDANAGEVVYAPDAAYADDYAISPDDPYAGFLDIDAALASVAALGAAERQALQDERADRAELKAAQAAQAEREAEERNRRALRPVKAPAPFLMHRGQMASVVPALALIVVGAWLTFVSTAPGAVPADPLIVAVVVVGAVILTMLAQWLSAGRWSRGVFFFAVLALLIAGILYYQMTAASWSLLGPLVLLAVGLSFGLTGLLARPADRRLLLPGLVFVGAGVAALAVALGVIPQAVIAGAAPFWPVLLAVVVVLWLLPIVVKRRG